MMSVCMQTSERSFIVKCTVYPCNVHNSHVCVNSLASSTYLLRVTPFLQPLRPSLFGAFSGKSLEGGLGGTLVLSRKIHFLFLISFPQRNLDKRFYITAQLHFYSIIVVPLQILHEIYGIRADKTIGGQVARMSGS